ncbi:hypothetical protein [Galbibacter pacificus]|uniref:DUF4412 domain-containing protein n=1 Tax=Galbibacter pacificus TaxID=2996052 RepID=A0ABT6FSA5_9FLAO|nr:hypothetical protein [Galbibacter pacificus]MDG3582723.1 hypothetical protein [Galbibacter pacificus]MDG3586158.1 hypothetical protein [Galbibacter pacificus]
MRIITYCFLFFTGVMYSQTNIHEEVMLGPNKEKEFFVAANMDDLIQFEVKRTDGKKISHFSLTALQSNNTVFTERRFRKFKSGITSFEKSVYRLLFKNNTQDPVAFDLDVDINSYNNQPAVMAYRTVYDTVYGEEKTIMETVEKLETKTLQKEKFYLNSKSNALVKGGKDRAVFPVYLPKNTAEWFYVLTANRDEEAIKATAKTFSLASELSKYIETEKNSLSTAVTNLNAPPGANICDIYLMNKTEATKFRAGEDYGFDIEGSRENYKSGIVGVKGTQSKAYFIGVKNPDNLYGIHVGIEVVAIVKEEKKVPKLVRSPTITAKQVPYVSE